MATAGGDAWINQAWSKGGESVTLSQRLLAEMRTRSERVDMRDKQVKLARSFAETHRALAPLVESLFHITKQVIGDIELALRMQEAVEIEETTWQLALVCLRQQKLLVETSCGAVRAAFAKLAKKTRLAASVWPANWDERYVDLLDDLDDITETIALGLSPEFRAGIEARSAEIKRHL